eukprot:TRINITY_DN1779_c0_g1_i2.p1 TRINITY_DN1779_c0_g1~~TRINITY_DN1779_c0_g1_i2.p1  ORF type:complete len:393 (+),score=127.24 TRINITY_DN1779_c0_g1_i2:131-1180(+)
MENLVDVLNDIQDQYENGHEEEQVESSDSDSDSDVEDQGLHQLQSNFKRGFLAGRRFMSSLSSARTLRPIGGFKRAFSSTTKKADTMKQKLGIALFSGLMNQLSNAQAAKSEQEKHAYEASRGPLSEVLPVWGAGDVADQSDDEQQEDVSDADQFHDAIRHSKFIGTRSQVCELLREKLLSHVSWMHPRHRKKFARRQFDALFGKTCSKNDADTAEPKEFQVKKKEDGTYQLDLGIVPFRSAMGYGDRVQDEDEDEFRPIIRAAFAPATRSATCQRLKMGMTIRVKKRFPQMSDVDVAKLFAKRFGRFCGVDEAVEKDTKHSRAINRVKVSPNGNSVEYSSGFTWSNEE